MPAFAVQMAKAGILEVADVFIVNKADRDGAAAVVRELRQMLHLGPVRPWDPPVLSTTATTDEGIAELWSTIEEHGRWAVASGGRDAKRRDRLLREVESLGAERLRLDLTRALDADADLVERLVSRAVDPYGAAAELVRGVRDERSA